MKYALIGCGRIAINHLKAAIENKLEIVALCDIDSSHIENLIERLGTNIDVEKYSDFKEMLLVHPEIELVAIATDSGVHAEIASYCLRKNVNVIVEKPIAMSIADAENMISLAETNNLVLSVCHQNRFNFAVQDFRKAIEEGRFGKISHGAICVRWSRDKNYYDQASWRGKWLSDGGTLMNQCIHGIDLLRWMLGDEIDEVYGTIKQQYHSYTECEDVGLAVVKFKNGAIGTIEGTVNVFPKNLEETLYVFGQEGTAKLGGTSCNDIDLWDFKEIKSGDLEIKSLHENTKNVYGNGHLLLYKDVISAIKNKTKPYIDGYAGKNALELVLAIYKSQLTGLPVKLPLKDFGTKEMIGFFEKEKGE